MFHSRLTAAKLLAFAAIGLVLPSSRASAQTNASQPVVVHGEELLSSDGASGAFSLSRFSNLTNAYSKLVGQFRGGLEVRITHNIGWTNHLSWGVISSPRNNFGMIRTGLNSAF